MLIAMCLIYVNCRIPTDRKQGFLHPLVENDRPHNPRIPLTIRSPTHNVEVVIITDTPI